MSKNKSEKELVVVENKENKLEKSENITNKSENVTNKTEVVVAKKSESAIVSWWKETVQFLREVWIEVRPNKGRVTWPTFASVRISTRVVIVSSVILGLFIGLCDFIFTIGFSKILESFTNGTGIG